MRGGRGSDTSRRDVESSTESPRPRIVAGRTRCWHVGLIALVLINCGFIIKWDLLNASYFMSNSLFTSGFSTGTWIAEVNQTRAGQASGGLELGNSETCSEEWLEQADKITWPRNFAEQPVLVIANENQVWSSCGVPCMLKSARVDTPADGVIGLHETGVASILRSMESAVYYPDNDVDNARKKGFTVVMTTSLRSDVPVGYFSWAEYRIMEPPQPKTKQALATAFISNCGAHNFRLQAMELLMKEGVSIDSYGACLQNVKGGRGIDKVEALQRYKFSLAFENSNVEDYVTEKFFQSLVAGSVPVIVGAPNIEDFAPGPNTILHIRTLEDVPSVASRMKYLAQNDTAFSEAIRWKVDGPSDSFLALVDMAAVHSSCRLCIHLATQIRLKEEAAAPQRPCHCTSMSGNLYHIHVRERGRFESESIFLKESDLTEDGLKQVILRKFTDLKHVPVWQSERPEVIRGDAGLHIHRIYPVGLTQRQALYEWSFKGDEGVRTLVTENPCLKLEVIFV